MNKSEFEKYIAEKHSITQKEADKVIYALFMTYVQLRYFLMSVLSLPREAICMGDDIYWLICHAESTITDKSSY